MASGEGVALEGPHTAHTDTWLQCLLLALSSRRTNSLVVQNLWTNPFRKMFLTTDNCPGFGPIMLRSIFWSHFLLAEEIYHETAQPAFILIFWWSGGAHALIVEQCDPQITERKTCCWPVTPLQKWNRMDGISPGGGRQGAQRWCFSHWEFKVVIR